MPILITVLLSVVMTFLPVLLGHGMLMYAVFACYAMLVTALSIWDKRALGYALALSVCSPANGLALVPHSLLLASLIIVKEARYVSDAITRLRQGWWWLLLVLAFVAAYLSLPFWPTSGREFFAQFKQPIVRLGFASIVPLAITLTVSSHRDAIRIVLLVCTLTATVLAMFHFMGERGIPQEYYLSGARMSVMAAFQRVGMAYASFSRTQVCIVLAVLAATSVAVAVARMPRPQALFMLLIGGLSVFMIMQLASTGSAFAMVVGMGVAALGFVMSRPSAARITLSILVIGCLGLALIYAVFQTDNYLAERIAEKQQSGRIDRFDGWVASMKVAAVTPVGQGWTTEYQADKHTHNDFLCYFLSFGYISGAAFFASSVLIGLMFVRKLRQVAVDASDSRALVLAGLAATVVYGANSMLDMLSASIGNFQIVWMIILVAATSLLCTRTETEANMLPALAYAEG